MANEVQSKLTLQEDGYLRIRQVLQFIPVSKSTWWAGVSEGRFPKPTKLGPNTTAWSAKKIRQLIDELEAAA